MRVESPSKLVTGILADYCFSELEEKELARAYKMIYVQLYIYRSRRSY